MYDSVIGRNMTQKNVTNFKGLDSSSLNNDTLEKILPKNPFLRKVDLFFKVSERGSTLSKEIMAGLITFLSVAYILTVNPTILSASGLPIGGAFIATIVSSTIACYIMGLFGKVPIVLAPGMGINAFFSFTVASQFGFGLSWQEALGCVIINGIIFITLSLTGARRKILSAIPKELRIAITMGIGSFIAFIGLRNMNFFSVDLFTLNNVDSSLIQLSIGDFSDPALYIGLIGLILVVIFWALKMRTAVILSMIITVIIGVTVNYAADLNNPDLPTWGENNFSQFKEAETTIGKGFEAFESLFTNPLAYLAIFIFLFVDFFDTAGTLLALGETSDFPNKEKVFASKKLYIADATGTLVGGIFGTSSVTSFIESAAGIKAGSKTGLSSVVAGTLFLLSLAMYPLLSLFSNVVTGPILVFVGVLMFKSAIDINWKKWLNLSAAFFTIFGTLLTNNISIGLGLGFIFYSIIDIVYKIKHWKKDKMTWKTVRNTIPTHVLSLLFLIFIVIESLIISGKISI